MVNKNTRQVSKADIGRYVKKPSEEDTKQVEGKMSSKLMPLLPSTLIQITRFIYLLPHK